MVIKIVETWKTLSNIGDMQFRVNDQLTKEATDCRKTDKAPLRDKSQSKNMVINHIMTVDERVSSTMDSICKILDMGINFKSIGKNPQMTTNKEKKLLQISKLLKELLEDDTQDPIKPKVVPKPLEAKRPKKNVQRLINLCTGQQTPKEQRVILTDLQVSNKLNNMSYKDQKDVLINVFGLKPKDFSGITRNPNKGTISFLILEESFLKYSKAPPHFEAGRIIPWVSKDLATQAAVVATICAKIEAHEPHNRVFKKAARYLLSALTQDDLPCVAGEFVLSDINYVRKPEGSQ